MYERMLDKTVMPTIEELTTYCGATAQIFARLNDWLTETYGTGKEVVFPYGTSTVGASRTKRNKS